jgi:hypothetical protein
MDTVFDAQFRSLRDAFLQRGVDVRAAYTRSGEVDYLYEEGRLLTLKRQGHDPVDQLAQVFPQIRPTGEELRLGGEGGGAADSLLVLSVDDLGDGSMSVPEALDRLDRELGALNPAYAREGVPLATPVHVVHISRICPAGEPDVPPSVLDRPYPPPAPAGGAVRSVRVGVCDTGLLEGLDPVRYDWLKGVVGDPDPLGPALPGGAREIPQYTGHGTFVAGTLRCVAPLSDVIVTDHFSASGGELEHEIIRKLDELISTYQPDIVNLSAGTYCRGNRSPLGFLALRERWPNVTFVTAAGNDATDRPFYPAAFDWAIAVGALGPDELHRAWFSNYGDWVDVYALGEGMVNAYATGEYRYLEPPRRPAKQLFQGMASWDGTSFSAPIVAGLIAARCAKTGESAETATAEVLTGARVVEGTGRVLSFSVGA